jgi:hypothetical protein
MALLLLLVEVMVLVGIDDSIETRCNASNDHFWLLKNAIKNIQLAMENQRDPSTLDKIMIESQLEGRQEQKLRLDFNRSSAWRQAYNKSSCRTSIGII